MARHQAVLTLAAAAAVPAEKIVLNTPWWPPGTEKTAESVGIKTSDLIFCTGMMEQNQTHWMPADVAAEVRDVRDILQAGNANVDSIVECLVNAPPDGRSTTAVASALRDGLAKAGGQPDAVALTVVPMEGEYGTYFGTSISCVSTTQPPSGKRVARAVSGSGLSTAVAVAAELGRSCGDGMAGRLSLGLRRP